MTTHITLTHKFILLLALLSIIAIIKTWFVNRKIAWLNPLLKRDTSRYEKVMPLNNIVIYVIIILTVIYHVYGRSFCEYSALSNSNPELDTVKLQALLLHIDSNPRALYDVLNSSYKWDIIAAFTHNQDNFMKVNAFWIASCTVTGLEFYALPFYAIIHHWIDAVIVMSNISYLINLGIYIHYNIKLYETYAETCDIFIYFMEYLIKEELHAGNVSPEFLELLLNVFQI